MSLRDRRLALAPVVLGLSMAFATIPALAQSGGGGGGGGGGNRVTTTTTSVPLAGG
jgi:hypothetical protein